MAYYGSSDDLMVQATGTSSIKGNPDEQAHQPGVS